VDKGKSKSVNTPESARSTEKSGSKSNSKAAKQASATKERASKASVPKKKPGAAARKTGRPSGLSQAPVIATPSPPPRSQARAAGSSSTKRKPTTVPRAIGNSSRRSGFVRQDPISSESDDTSSDTDSDNVIVPDSVELTDQDTEEEQEAVPRITRPRLRSSSAVAKSSSPAKADAARKRKRIQESSEEEEAGQNGRNSGSESENEQPRRIGRLVKARDYRPPRRRKHRDSKPEAANVDGGHPTGRAADDFPPELDEYRDVLLANDVTSMSMLRQAIRDPSKSIKFVNYLAEVRYEASLWPAAAPDGLNIPRTRIIRSSKQRVSVLRLAKLSRLLSPGARPNKRCSISLGQSSI
jgi:hypothetical protein